MDIFQEILNALRYEKRIMLATIISVSGSTPASAFSKMIVKNGGAVALGTIGGGCLEGEVILHANRICQTGKAEILKFHLNEDDAGTGLICGGSLDVLIEPLTTEYIPIFRELQSKCSDGEDCVLATLISSEGYVDKKQIVDTGQTIDSPDSPIDSQIREKISEAASRYESKRVKTNQGEWIFEPIMGRPNIIIFGGGHVSKFVSSIAATAGFQVVIVDDREKYSNPERFPEAMQTIVSDFDKAFEKLKVKSSAYIVIVTRGHSYDEIVLEQALKTSAKYIGMIGSKRKILTAYRNLIKRGINAEQLERIHAPIGLDIGAVTAEEIGVSIVAELIRIRRGVKQSVRHMRDSIKP